jgi:hypothetical protein
VTQEDSEQKDNYRIKWSSEIFHPVTLDAVVFLSKVCKLSNKWGTNYNGALLNNEEM